MKKRLVLGERDIGVLDALHLHGALNMRKLAQLCFGEVSPETARKRLRKLHQAGYIGLNEPRPYNNKEEKGRPEHLYFLSALGSGVLARSCNISEDAIVIGPPNTNHKDHLERLVDLHLAWQRTARQEKITDFKFLTKRVALSSKNGNAYLNAAKSHADAVITFKRDAEDSQIMFLVLETGNLRQSRHWEPKINAFQKTNIPVLIVALNEKRLNTLREWTSSTLKAASMQEEPYIFRLYDEIVNKGFYSSIEYCTKHGGFKIPILSS